MKMSHLLPLLLLLASLAPYAENSYAESSGKVGSKESYQRTFCDKFEMAQDTVDVETIFEDMDASPYASHWLEFWTTPACTANNKLDSKVPMIFNTANDPVFNEQFPQAVRDYLLEVMNDKTSWSQIINTKSSDGLTFLDYMHYNISIGNYLLPQTKDAASRIVRYLCQHGGVYSKYKDTVKCP